MNYLDNPLLFHMAVDFASVNIFVFQVLSLAASLVLVFFAIRQSRVVCFVPGFWLIFGWCFVYLIPAIFYGGNIVRGLPRPESYFFLFVVNIIPVALGAWILIVARFLKFRPNADSVGVASKKEGVFAIILLILASLLVLVIWMRQVPIDCTGGWAILFDPERALLAREVSGKLSDAPFAWRLMGGYISVLAPLLLFFCGLKIIELFRVRSWRSVLGASALIVLMCLVLLSLFINATKGNLIPSAVVCVVGVAVMAGSKSQRVLAMVVVLLIAYGAITLLQNLVTGGGQTRKYEFGSCVARLQACDQGKVLVETGSVRRVGSIVGRSVDLPAIARDFEMACGLKVQLIGHYEEEVRGSHEEEVRGSHEEEVRRGNEEVVKMTGGSLFERGFKVPLQVASWYFLWGVESGHSDSIAHTIPFLSGDALLAKKVYQKYGSIYSGGDVTSTSTAPTSFLMAYPSSMGWMGLGLGLVLLILFDCLYVYMVRLLKPPISYGIVGVGAFLAYGFLNTDFFTVIGSHGGLASIIVVLLFEITSLLLRCFHHPRKDNRDTEGVGKADAFGSHK